MASFEVPAPVVFAATGGSSFCCVDGTPVVPDEAAFEPSPSPTAFEPSPSPTAFEPSPSPTAFEPSPSPTAFEPLPSPKRRFLSIARCASIFASNISSPVASCFVAKKMSPNASSIVSSTVAVLSLVEITIPCFLCNSFTLLDLVCWYAMDFSDLISSARSNSFCASTSFMDLISAANGLSLPRLPPIFRQIFCLIS